MYIDLQDKQYSFRDKKIIKQDQDYNFLQSSGNYGLRGGGPSDQIQDSKAKQKYQAGKTSDPTLKFLPKEQPKLQPPKRGFFNKIGNIFGRKSPKQTTLQKKIQQIKKSQVAVQQQTKLIQKSNQKTMKDKDDLMQQQFYQIRQAPQEKFYQVNQQFPPQLRDKQPQQKFYQVNQQFPPQLMDEQQQKSTLTQKIEQIKKKEAQTKYTEGKDDLIQQKFYQIQDPQELMDTQPQKNTSTVSSGKKMIQGTKTGFRVGGKVIKNIGWGLTQGMDQAIATADQSIDNAYFAANEKIGKVADKGFNVLWHKVLPAPLKMVRYLGDLRNPVHKPFKLRKKLTISNKNDFQQIVSRLPTKIQNFIQNVGDELLDKQEMPQNTKNMHFKQYVSHKKEKRIKKAKDLPLQNLNKLKSDGINYSKQIVESVTQVRQNIIRLQKIPSQQSAIFQLRPSNVNFVKILDYMNILPDVPYMIMQKLAQHDVQIRTFKSRDQSLIHDQIDVFAQQMLSNKFIMQLDLKKPKIIEAMFERVIYHMTIWWPAKQKQIFIKYNSAHLSDQMRFLIMKFIVLNNQVVLGTLIYAMRIFIRLLYVQKFWLFLITQAYLSTIQYLTTSPKQDQQNGVFANEMYFRVTKQGERKQKVYKLLQWNKDGFKLISAQIACIFLFQYVQLTRNYIQVLYDEGFVMEVDQYGIQAEPVKIPSGLKDDKYERIILPQLKFVNGWVRSYVSLTKKSNTFYLKKQGKLKQYVDPVVEQLQQVGAKIDQQGNRLVRTFDQQGTRIVRATERANDQLANRIVRANDQLGNRMVGMTNNLGNRMVRATNVLDDTIRSQGDRINNTVYAHGNMIADRIQQVREAVDNQRDQVNYTLDRIDQGISDQTHRLVGQGERTARIVARQGIQLNQQILNFNRNVNRGMTSMLDMQNQASNEVIRQLRKVQQMGARTLQDFNQNRQDMREIRNISDITARQQKNQQIKMLQIDDKWKKQTLELLSQVQYMKQIADQLKKQQIKIINQLQNAEKMSGREMQKGLALQQRVKLARIQVGQNMKDVKKLETQLQRSTTVINETLEMLISKSAKNEQALNQINNIAKQIIQAQSINDDRLSVFKKENTKIVANLQSSMNALGKSMEQLKRKHAQQKKKTQQHIMNIARNLQSFSKQTSLKMGTLTQVYTNMANQTANKSQEARKHLQQELQKLRSDVKLNIGQVKSELNQLSRQNKQYKQDADRFQKRTAQIDNTLASVIQKVEKGAHTAQQLEQLISQISKLKIQQYFTAKQIALKMAKQQKSFSFSLSPASSASMFKRQIQLSYPSPSSVRSNRNYQPQKLEFDQINLLQESLIQQQNRFGYSRQSPKKQIGDFSKYIQWSGSKSGSKSNRIVEQKEQIYSPKKQKNMFSNLNRSNEKEKMSNQMVEQKEQIYSPKKQKNMFSNRNRSNEKEKMRNSRMSEQNQSMKRSSSVKSFNTKRSNKSLKQQLDSIRLKPNFEQERRTAQNMKFFKPVDTIPIKVTQQVKRMLQLLKKPLKKSDI